MTTIQQEQTLNYFREHAGKWRLKAEGPLGSCINVIEQRNDFVLQVLDEHPAVRSFLDVGCGTGELVCNAAKRGINVIGVDFSQEMTDLATQKASDESIMKAKFVCSSIFDFDLQRKSYDLISAIGFIEYISQDEMNIFFDLVADALISGGSFVVGSRNRLFNLVSMNDFTLQELEAGSIELLFKEAVRWANANDVKEVLDIDCAPLQSSSIKHVKTTGIDVSTRFQYSPLQLINLLRDRGLMVVEVYPVNVHGVTPVFGKENAEVQASIANLLQGYARHNTQLITQASTFMLHVKSID
ncbi:MAG: methyltransferase domain-containing protein [Nitrospinaceae bacterium]|jgi:SAM-dependent methyltransferase|nr:methyltransferase domain-containing protein [Nitrospinaceae bacterium]